MATGLDKNLDSLVLKLPEFRDMEFTPERHIFLLWALTSAVTHSGGERPILVGGGAIEFYTSTRFSTGDLDLIAPDMKITKEVLKELGFERPTGARHYVNRAMGALVEIHSSRLRQHEEAIELVYRKVPLLLISPEDCIVHRLASYKKHESTVDLLNSFMLAYHQADRLDMERLTSRLHEKKLWDYYIPIQDICRELVINQIGVDEAAASLIHFMNHGAKECAF